MPQLPDPESPPPGPLAAALEELAGFLLATDSFQGLMQRIAELAVRSIPSAVTCGITMTQGGRVVTIAASDALGTLLDEQQYSLDEGPCLEAMYTATIITAPDLSTETRWHGYPQRAITQGISAVYSSPVIIRGRTIGVLNLYASDPRVFDPPTQRDAIAQLVTLTGVAITGTLRNYGDVTLSDQLQAALNSRSIIDQAMGIIMATQHCTADQAFIILRGVSETSNTRLNQVAQELVDRTTNPAT